MKTLLLLVSMTAFSTFAGAQSAPEYVPTSQAGPHGTAPGMKVKLLSDNNGQKDYAVVFQPGDEFFAGLTQFAEEYHVQSAHLTAVGGLHDARLSWYDESRKAYRVIPVERRKGCSGATIVAWAQQFLKI